MAEYPAGTRERREKRVQEGGSGEARQARVGRRAVASDERPDGWSHQGRRQAVGATLGPIFSYGVSPL